jgi:hypothetical protein
MTIHVGRSTMDAEVSTFDSVEEAREQLADADLLALINRAYRLRQLTVLRRDLERHPRRSL